MKWTYRIERVLPTQDGMAALLNAGAAEGWELLTAVAITDGVPIIFFVFRRPA